MNRTNRMRRLRKDKGKRIGRRALLLCLIAVLAAGGYALVERLTEAADEQAEQPAPPSQPENSESRPQEAAAITLSFAGDVMMSGNVEKLLQEKGYDYPFAHVKPLFLADDVTIVNLETPVTGRGTPSDNKAFVYKSSPAALPAMKEAGIDAVNLANNHSLDQGVEGLLDTLDGLEEQHIEYVGAGRDASRAYAPVYFEKNGIRLALLGFSRVVPEYGWYAGANKPGVAASYDPTLAVQAIRQAREKADVVAVIAHWGKERADEPADHQTELARAYIDAGADLVIGGHPHVLQGFETYKGKWIAYSLGNFIFTRAQEPRTWESAVLQASCTKRGDCELTMLPYHAELGQAVPMNAEDGALLLERIQSLSNGVVIRPNGRLE